MNSHKASYTVYGIDFTETVITSQLNIVDGSLIIYDDNNVMVRIYAAGYWLKVLWNHWI